MNWIDYISNLNSTNQSETYEMYLPATDIILQNLKTEFGLKELPKELEELYQQTNGIGELYNIQSREKELIAYVIWTIEEVIETNREFRNNPIFKEIYMSFDQLLFISDAGNGDLLGFRLCERQDIFIWNHEDDSRNWVAPNLTAFIKRRIGGKI